MADPPVDVLLADHLGQLGFDEILTKTLATATVDRLLHQAQVVVTGGESFRLAAATSGRGGDAELNREQNRWPSAGETVAIRGRI